VSLSPTLSKIEKVGQHIRKNIHKSNALRFWIKGSVIPLCVLTLVLIIVCLSSICLTIYMHRYE